MLPNKLSNYLISYFKHFNFVNVLIRKKSMTPFFCIAMDLTILKRLTLETIRFSLEVKVMN